MRPSWCLVLSLALALCALGQTATPPPPPPPAEPAADAEPARTTTRVLVYNLDPNTRISTGTDRSVVARGKLLLVLPDDELIAYADNIDYSGTQTGIATLTGNLRMLSGEIVGHGDKSAIPQPEHTLVGAIAWVFTKEKRAVVEGDLDGKLERTVVLVRSPQEEMPEDADRFDRAKYEPLTLRCDRLTFWYRRGDRKAVAAPKAPKTTIHFAQETQRGTAGRATYFEIPEERADTGDILDLEGGVLISNDDGDSIEAGAARIFVDTETSQWFMLKSLVLNVEEEDEEETAPAEPPAETPPEPTPEPEPTEPLPEPPTGQDEPAAPPAPPSEPSLQT